MIPTQYLSFLVIFLHPQVLLEILTGLPVCDETHILTKVDDLMDKHNDIVLLIDKRAEMSDEKSAQELYDLASECTEQKVRRRPDIGKVRLKWTLKLPLLWLNQIWS